MNLLHDKVCLVTGGSRGIGKSIVEKMSENGAKVYALASSLESFKDWDIDGKNITLIAKDLENTNHIKDVILQIRKESKKIDVLVNNAAVEFNERIGMISKENMEEMFNVNVYAPIELIQTSSRLMARNKSGSIINITSLVGERGNEGQLAYSATKGALMSVTKSAAKELASQNIRVNAVAPGLTETDMMNQVTRDVLQKRIDNISLGKIATPDDIANAVLFLASDLSSHITGQILTVDGCTIM